MTGAWVEQIGPAYTRQQVARLLGISDHAVATREDLLALTQRDGRVVYPAMQFDGDRPAPGLDRVLTVLTPVVATPWTIASWLTSTAPDGRRPIDQLKHGEIDHVINDAHRTAQSLGH